MKEFSCLFEDEESFKAFIAREGVDTGSRLLVFMYASGLSPADSVKAASCVKSLLPYAEIAGSTSYCVNLDGQMHENCMMLRIVQFEKSRFSIKFLPHKNVSPAELSLDIVGNICDQTTKAMVIHVSGAYCQLSDFIDEFNKLVPDITITGGPATSEKSFFWGFVFDECNYYMQHFLVVTFSGNDLHTFSFPLNNVEPIGDIYEVTKAHDGVVEEVSGRPILDFISDTLGIDVTANDDNIKLLDRFPVVLVDHNNATRQLVYTESDRSISSPVGMWLKTGDRIRNSYMSSRISYNHYSTMIDEINLFPTETLWAYSCFLRPQLYASMHPQIINFFGPRKLSLTYVGGEFANDDDRNELYTGTISYLGMTENMDAPVALLDKSMLKPILSDDNDTADIYNYVLVHQSEEVLAAKEELLRRISEQEKKATISLFVDKNTGMYNVEKYSYDSEKYSYRKLALVVIEKSVQLSNYFGTAEYIDYYKQNVDLFVNYLKEQNYLAPNQETSLVNIYCNDLSSFIIAASDRISSDDFMELMRRLFLRYNKHYGHNGTVCMNNFFIVVDQSAELLEKAKLLLSEKKNALKRFVVYEESHKDVENFEESLAALAVVNYAIEPFFQPIYDNTKGCTYKFESLMRIKDSNGKLWFPNQFLPVAKEFRLYLQLSCAMINKVFDLFDGREESVSINLSAIDINSEMVTNMIYMRLKTLKNPNHFIFEILESDAFEDLNLLSDFIRNLREYNVMIAIDDFGAGYSNLLEIVKLKPDIIKIDGEIIKHLLHDEVNRNIMDVIIYMADRFSVDLVAEYAESKELQDFLKEKGIRYSQGYYFSKPLPYDQIDAYLASERKAKESGSLENSSSGSNQPAS
ncbi:MAG: EAL domain-containing protein [Succinivibrionaceae bacterium]|nr:EAL domain-containing protein [Succinivibrionaceae bacterium]